MKKTIRSLSVLLVLLMLVSMLPVQALATNVSVTDADGQNAVETEVTVDAATAIQTGEFGKAAADGRVAVDKSVSLNETDKGFDIVLSAMGQEYLYSTTNLEDMNSKEAADVLLILDLSGSMSDELETEGDTSKVEAMVAAVNQTIDTVMKANPNNRVMVSGYREANSGCRGTTSGYVTILSLASYKAGATSGGVGLYLENITSSGYDIIRTNSKLMKVVNGTASSVSQVSYALNNGTYIQMGIANAAATLISEMQNNYGTEIRHPFVLLLTDGNANGANTTWTGDCTSSNVSVSNSAYGNVEGDDPTNDACRIVALTILTAAYQKNQITQAYNNKNASLGLKDTPTVTTNWYNIGLGFNSASDAASAGALQILLQPELAQSSSGSNTPSKRIYDYLVSYAGTSGYSPAVEPNPCCYATENVYFTKTVDTLSGAFASLADQVSKITSGTVMPVKPLSVGTKPYDPYITFTDNLGTGTTLKKNGDGNYAISIVYNGVTYTGAPTGSGNTYAFSDGTTTLVSQAEVTANQVIWKLDADELPVVRFANRLDPKEGVYESKETTPVKLCYTALLDHATLAQGTTAYANALNSSTATAVFKPSPNNSYYYSDTTNKTKKSAESAEAKASDITGTNIYTRSYAWSGDEYIVTLGNNGKAVPAGGGTLAYSEFIDTDKNDKADYLPATDPQNYQTQEMKAGATVTLALNGGTYNGEASPEALGIISEQTTTALNPVKEGYVFVGWVLSGSDKDGWTLTAQYEEDSKGDETEPDTKGDNIPDIFQKKVTFKIENGFWTGEDKADKVLYATLVDGEGKATSLSVGKATVELPLGDAEYKYVVAGTYAASSGAWDEPMPAITQGEAGKQTIEVSGAEEVEYKYTFDEYADAQVEYSKYIDVSPADGKADRMPVTDTVGTKYEAEMQLDLNLEGATYDGKSGSVTVKVTEATVEAGTNILKLKDPVVPENANKVFVGWVKTDTPGGGEGYYTFKAMYEDDTNGNDTADVFEKVITFKVVNGTWSDDEKADISVALPLYEGEGEGKYLSAAGTGTLATEQIPAGMKSDGKHGSNGSWMKENGDTLAAEDIPLTYTGTAPVTYTYAFNVKVNFQQFQGEVTTEIPTRMPVDTTIEVPYGSALELYLNGGSYDKQTELVDERGAVVDKIEGEDVIRIPSLTENIEVADASTSLGNLVFVGWLYGKETQAGATVLKAIFADDQVGKEDPNVKDGIPDVFEEKVTFKIVNGTWGGSGTEIVKYAPLTKTEGEDQRSYYCADGTGSVTVPTNMKEAAGYDPSSGKWQDGMSISEGMVTVSKTTGGTSYTYTYGDLTEVKVTYNEFIDQLPVGAPDGIADKAPEENSVTTYYGKTLTIVKGEGTYTGIGADGLPVTLTADQTIPDPTTTTEQKIVFVGWVMTKDETGNITLTAQYAADENKDGDPEIFQKKVTFRIVNGTWSGGGTEDDIRWVTLYTGGKWDANGTGTLTAPTGMTADANHTQDSGAWNVDAPATEPPTTVQGKAPELLFIYEFGALVNRDVNYNGLDGEDSGLEPDPAVEPVPHGSKIVIDPNVNGTYNSSKDEASVGPVEAETTLDDAVADDGFTFIGWTVSYPEQGGADYYCKFTANYKPDENVSYKKFVDGNQDDEPDTEPVYISDSETEEYGTIITIKPDGGVGGTYKGEAAPEPITVLDEAIVIDDGEAPDGYVFVGWSKTYDKEVGEGGIEVENGNVTYWAHYAVDEVGGNWENGYASDGDGVADLFQAKVTYQVKNGSWSATNAADTADRYEYVTLKNEAGLAAQDGAARIQHIPAGMQPDVAHKATPAAWTPATTELVEEVPVGVLVTENKTFEYEFTELADRTLTFNAFQDDGQGNPASKPVSDTKTLTYGTTVNVEGEEPFELTNNTNIPDPAAPEFKVFMGWKYDPDTVTLTPVFVDDVNDDDIPDMYQRLVTFTVVNGSFASGKTEKTAWVTLLDTDGNWSKTGTASIQAPTDMQPDGIHAAPGTWNEEPDETGAYTITSALEKPEYTYTYNLYRSFDVNYNEADDDDPDTAPKKATLQVIYGGKVTIDPNGGKYKGSAEKQEITITGTTNIADATREGYIFLGWKAGEMDKDGSYTLTAQWVEAPAAPPTGDSSRLALWSGMMTLALAGMALVLGRKKRRENEA